MTTATVQRDAFAPQPPGGMRSSFGLAVAAHVLLVLALAWSVNWKASEPEGVVAELWSASPQIAAPRAVAPEPRPSVVEPRPVRPTPPAPPLARAEPAPRPREDPQIAVERAAREKARRVEIERTELARQAEKKQRDELRRAQQLELAEQQKKRLAAEQAEKKKLAEQEKQDEARQAAIREANLKRAMRQAGSSDEATATGNTNVSRTSGPSASYAGRIKARIMPNIVLLTPVAGKPLAEVELRLAPDGTIVGRKLVKPSGSAVWDEAVLRAIDKTEVLPRDTDGRVISPMTIALDPGR